MKFSSVITVCLVHLVLGHDTRVQDSSANSYVSNIASQDMEASASGYIFNRGAGLGSYGGFGGLRSGLSGGLNQLSGGSGFNFPTKYSIGSTGGGFGGGIGGGIEGGIGLGNYNNIGGYEAIGDEGIGLGGGGGLGYVGSNVGGGGLGGGLGYGISKNGIGLAGLGPGLGAGLGAGSGQGISNLGSGITQGGSLGYGGITGVGLQHGQFIPATVGLGGVGLGGGGGVASESSFKKGGGADFKAVQEAAEGEKGEKGYKVAEGFDKGTKGAVAKAQDDGHYSESGGAKKGAEEEAKKYAASEAGTKGEKGEKFHKSEGHKKGSKTTGFHNVYRKDEYKKDTSFYDDEHNSGQEEKYGSENVHHSAKKGAHEKAEKLDAAYQEDEHAKKGGFTNGHQYGTVQGHDREEGEKEQYDNEIEYAKKAAHKAGNEEGVVSADSYGKKIY